ncbi:MAG: EAL domain-containing protein [Methylococcales bacterium]
MCFFDVDNFKSVNDRYGHDVGDQLLIEISQRVQATIREDDTVSRQGGDEFALLLNEIGTLVQCKKMISRLHQALALPYRIKDHIITISVSSGFTLYPTDNADLDILMRHADQAMYQAKQEGKNRFHVFNAEQNREVVKKTDRLNDIEYALQHKQLCLYYQPKVNMETGKVFGAEALMRWQHPEKGLIPPLDFLPVLEETELEITLGNWVIEQALIQLDCWRKQDIDLEVSINISSHHLQSTRFFSVIKEALALHPDVDSRCLQLEILESSALGDLATISKIIKTCQDELGVSVALDDFGTGYSSLTHMKNLPAEVIKIDQSFVRDMLEDPDDYLIIDGIIGLADSFNREVIAEGVETTQHGLMLQLMGCGEAQGYGIARPMPADKMAIWLKKYTPNQQWMASNHKSITPKDRAIKLLKLTIDYWYDDIKNKLAFVHEHAKAGSIKHKNKTHIYAWIKRARKEELFPEEWLDSLSQTYNAMIFLGDGLLQMHQNKESGSMTKDKGSLTAAYNEVITLLTGS